MVLGPAQPIGVGSCPKQDLRAGGVAFSAKSCWVWFGSQTQRSSQTQTTFKKYQSVGSYLSAKSNNVDLFNF